MILKGFLALGIGLVLIWVGRNNWIHRDTEAIPLIENAILKATNQEPLPRTNFDRISRRIQAFLGFVLGAFFAGVGLIMLGVFGE